jgi:hypothetical protein
MCIFRNRTSALSLSFSLLLAPLVLVLGCNDDANNDGSSDETQGDGDPGDGDPGDGDPGDGDPGDGDPGDGDPGDGDPGDGDPDIDEQAILDAIADYPDTFVLINAAPFTSQHMGMMVNIWVDPNNAAQYKSIDPENPAPITLPEGAIIVKEHLDGDDVAGGTVMVKGPAGYSPDDNDWWFAMGNLLGGELADSGPSLGGCIGCHSAVSETDYLFGVDSAEQNP